MTHPETATWLGYDFGVYEHEVDWQDTAGVYAFAHRIPEHPGWKLLYVGQTESFGSRLPTHEDWSEAARAGATHVHAREVAQASLRDEIEKRMIAEYNPYLNVKGRTDT